MSKKKTTREALKQISKRERYRDFLNREWYSLRSMLSYSWAIFLFLLGGREAGKSYAVTDFYVRQWRRYGRPFYWMRLTDKSAEKLLKNNAEKLIDPDLRRKYNLDLETRGDGVYEVKRNDKGKVTERYLMCRVLALSTFYNDKGSGLFDKDFLSDPKMYYNICLDEMNREQSEKNTFDIVYAFTNQLENLIRSTKTRVRVICIGNTLQEASDILCAFNFIPEQFGRFKLKSKRAVIEYIEPSEKYEMRRAGTVADILMPTASTFTNVIEQDYSLVAGKRVTRPSFIVQFTKEEKYTIWDGNIVAKYNGEHVPVIAMRPYQGQTFLPSQRDEIMLMFDARALLFKNLVTFKQFQKQLELLKPRK